MVFDVIFMVQHYCLFASRSAEYEGLAIVGSDDPEELDGVDKRYAALPQGFQAGPVRSR